MAGIGRLHPKVVAVVGVAPKLKADQVVILGITHAAGIAVGGRVQLLLLARGWLVEAKPGRFTLPGSTVCVLYGLLLLLALVHRFGLLGLLGLLRQ